MEVEKLVSVSGINLTLGGLCQIVFGHHNCVCNQLGNFCQAEVFAALLLGPFAGAMNDDSRRKFRCLH